MAIAGTIVTDGTQTLRSSGLLATWGVITVFHWRSWRFVYDLESLSDRIACQCRAAILQRVQSEASIMTVAEASGYIRARACGMVAFHTGLVLAETGAPRELGPELAIRAKRRVVAGVLDDLKRPRRKPSVRRRAA